jgi:hypothetical protein
MAARSCHGIEDPNQKLIGILRSACRNQDMKKLVYKSIPPKHTHTHNHSSTTAVSTGTPTFSSAPTTPPPAPSGTRPRARLAVEDATPSRAIPWPFVRAPHAPAARRLPRPSLSCPLSMPPRRRLPRCDRLTFLVCTHGASWMEK